MQVLTETSDTAPERRPILAFGEVSIDAARLEPRSFDLLRTLSERPGVTASRDYLMETVWGEAPVSSRALNLAVTEIREALGDDATAPRFIETVPELGYRWIFEEPRHAAPAARWSLAPTWVVAGAALAIAVGSGAYAWAQRAEPDAVEIGEPRSFVER